MGNEPDGFRLMALADLPQGPIARKGLLPTHCRHGGPSKLLDRRLWEIATMPVQPWSELMAIWLEPFRAGLTEPAFRHALALVTSARHSKYCTESSHDLSSVA